MKISQILRDTLKENERTQKELSQFIGVSTSTVNNWIKLDRSIPAEYIIPICEFLKISPYRLLIGEEKELSGKNINCNNAIEKEALNLFKQLPEHEQLKLIGRMEILVEDYEKTNSEEQ